MIATLNVRTPVENPQPRSGLTDGPVDLCVESGATKVHSNVGVPVKPDAEPTNVHDTEPLAGATHGRFCTVNEPVGPMVVVVDVEDVVVDVVIEVGGTVVVVDEGPLPPPQAVPTRIITAIAIA